MDQESASSGEASRLEWSYEGNPTSGIYTDLQGHFWAEAELRTTGRWFFQIWDYQNNALVEGTASTLEGAQAVVQGWNDWVVTSPYDPSQDYRTNDEDPLNDA